MKVLAVSDKPEPRFMMSGKGVPHAQEIELVLACGDLPASYLEHLVTILNVPLYYVLGNHDEQLYGQHLCGCTCLDEATVMFKNRIFGGLSGSIRYSDGRLTYSEEGMMRKISRLFPQLLFNRLRFGRHLDILITHSPLYGMLDEATRTHQGFRVLRIFDKHFRPHYHLHGHTLIASGRYWTRYHTTKIVNINHYRILDI